MPAIKSRNPSISRLCDTLGYPKLDTSNLTMDGPYMSIREAQVEVALHKQLPVSTSAQEYLHSSARGPPAQRIMRTPLKFEPGTRSFSGALLPANPPHPIPDVPPPLPPPSFLLSGSLSGGHTLWTPPPPRSAIPPSPVVLQRLPLNSSQRPTVRGEESPASVPMPPRPLSSGVVPPPPPRWTPQVYEHWQQWKGRQQNQACQQRMAHNKQHWFSHVLLPEQQHQQVCVWGHPCRVALKRNESQTQHL